MRIARAILAVLIAVSLAFAPVAAMAAPAPKAAAPAAVSVDCDHHLHGHALPQKSPPGSNHCAAMINCGFCFVTLTGVSVVLLSHDAELIAAIEPLRLSGPPLSWMMAAPFRPPRV